MDFVTQNVEVSPFLAWLARTSLQGSVLICLILLVQRIARGKLPVRWRYCFWLLLLVRLALPWAPQSRMSVFNLLEPAKVVLDDDNGGSEMVVVELPMVTTAATESVFTKHEEPKKDIAGTDQAAVQSQAVSIKGVGLLSLVWLTGVVVLAAAILAANFKLWWIVKRLRPLTDQKILDLLEDCKEQMGIRTIVAVVVTDKVKSPALFGFIRPRLLLPVGMIEAVGLEELRYIFLHELAHLRRHDIYLGWVTAVLQVLHWFNPLIWFGFYRMRVDRELACDGLALETMGADEPKKYGRTIVNLLEHFSQRQYVPSMAGILENKANLKRRITMIANFKKASKKHTIAAIGLIFVLACIALTNAENKSASRYNDRLTNRVTVDVDHSPKNGKLSVQYAVIAVCKDVGIPYQWDKSTKLADPERNRFIKPVHIKDVPLEKALLDILTPVGLQFGLDENGLYLYRPDAPKIAAQKPSEKDDKVQILVDCKLFEIPVELARKELGWVPEDPENKDPIKTGGVIAKMGQEYAGRLERLRQGKGNRLLASPRTLVLDGKEAVLTMTPVYPCIVRYETDSQTGKTKPDLLDVEGSIVLKVTGTIQDADRKIIKLDMNFEWKKPSLTTQQDQDGYEYQVPVMNSQVVSTTCLVENGQPLIISGFEGYAKVHYLEITAKVMPPEEIDSQGKQNIRTSCGAPATQSTLAERMNQPITYQCTEQPIGKVLGQLAEWADVDIIKSEEIQGDVTFKVTNVPLKEVLRNILAAHGWGYVQTENMIRVAPLGKIDSQDKTDAPSEVCPPHKAETLPSE